MPAGKVEWGDRIWLNLRFTIKGLKDYTESELDAVCRLSYLFFIICKKEI